jgi:lysophospholipase L1-like esterase
MVCYTYTVPEGIASVRLNVAEGEKELFAIMKNEFTSDQYQRLTGQKAADAEDPLFKKKCLFIGDSICAAGADSGSLKGWARRVQEATGAECYNEGVSGAALSDCRLSRPGAGKNHQIYKQLEEHKNIDFDYVLIHGGVNDAWDSKPIGSVSSGYDSAGFDLSTYAGGLEMTIYTAVEMYGDTAAIGYLMNFQLPQCSYGVVAQKMGDYFAVGKEICEKWGISYFDMFNDSKINNQMQVTGNKYLPDGVHPNEGGYDILGPYITKYMKTMTPTTQKILEELASQ